MCAREFTFALDYNKGENFHKVIRRAVIACENNGYNTLDHIPEVGEMIGLAKRVQRAKILAEPLPAAGE